MGNWINKDGWAIAIHNFDNLYLKDLVVFMALGGGWSASVVLGCLDETYAEARKRGIVWGLWGRLLKWHTKRLWKGKLKNKRTYARDDVGVPSWVDRVISSRLTYHGSCD